MSFEENRLEQVQASIEQMAGAMGVKPYKRYHMPTTESDRLVMQAQDGCLPSQMALLLRNTDVVTRVLNESELFVDPAISEHDLIASICLANRLASAGVNLSPDLRSSLYTLYRAGLPRHLEREFKELSASSDRDKVQPTESINHESMLLTQASAADAINSIDPSILSHREKLVLSLRFGLNGGEKRLREDIGRTLGFSAEYIRQVENRALGKISRQPDFQDFIELLRLDVSPQANEGLPDEPPFTLPESEVVHRFDARAEYLERSFGNHPLTRAWIKGLIERQQAGKLVFVRGEMLRGALPDDVKEFLGKNWIKEHNKPAQVLASLREKHDSRPLDDTVA
jgi:hypothetical protein